MKRVLSILLVGLALATSVAAEVVVTVRPGGWSDVVKTPDGFELVRATSAEIVRERANGTPVWRVPLPEPMLYLRAAADSIGVVRAVAQGNHSGLAYSIGQEGLTTLGPSFGQNATAIFWSLPSGFLYYVQTSPTTYVVHTDGRIATRTVTMAATSQGFRDIQPDGTVRRGDDYMTAPFHGRQLWSMSQRGNVTVGQCDPPGICAVADGQVFTIVRGNAFEPHLALGDGGVFAVATRTDYGAALAIVSPPYPPADVADTPPAPPPSPEPTSQTRIAPDRMSVVADVIRAHPEIDSCDEVARGAIVDYAAQRLNKAEGRIVWGRKSRGKPNGDRAVNPNTDGLTFLRPDGRFEIYDVISGSPPCGATWDGFGPFNPGENGWWAPPQLGDEPSAGGDKPPPPPPPPGLVTRAELDAAIAALRLELRAAIGLAKADALEGVDALERRLSARIDAIRPIDLAGIQAAIDAALANLQVVGKTRVSFGHQHLVELGVARKQ